MKVFLWLLKIFAPAWPVLLLASFLGLLTVGSSIGLLATAAFLISAAALHPPVLDLMPAVVGVRFFGISRAVFRYLERYVAHAAAFRVLGRLRVWFYQALEPLAPAGLTGLRSGDLLGRVVADVQTLERFSLRVLTPPLTALLVLAGAFIFLACFEVRLALVLPGFFLAAGVVLPLLLRRLNRGALRRLAEVRGELSAGLVDAVWGMEEILAFNQAAGRQAQIAGLGRELQRLQGKMAGLNGVSAAAAGLAGGLALWAVLWLAIPLVSRGELDGVYLAMLALGAQAGFEAVLPLPLIFPSLEESLAAAQRLFAVTRQKPAVFDPPGPSPQAAGFALRVRGLRFRYGPGEPYALDGVDFNLSPGGRLAIVGPSGAGKSTLVNLLLRFWDYAEGSIELGGCELKSYAQEDLRALLAVAGQRPHLFNATIRENLLLAKPGARPEELAEAARAAQIHDFIQSLPRGYDTVVGEGGLKLSGGQRRRLAIARALLKDAPFLILDEPAADLDPVTERALWQAIRGLGRERAVLVITHRLTGLELMDEILVLERGRVVERGRHEALLRRNGVYRRLFELQQEGLVSTASQSS